MVRTFVRQTRLHEKWVAGNNTSTGGWKGWLSYQHPDSLRDQLGSILGRPIPSINSVDLHCWGLAGAKHEVG